MEFHSDIIPNQKVRVINHSFDGVVTEIVFGIGSISYLVEWFDGQIFQGRYFYREELEII